jgi:hypothetical protein
MRAVPQTQVYAGFVLYIPSQFNMAIQAMINFQARNKDPKAEIIEFLAITAGQFFLSVYCFYDAPMAPNELSTNSYPLLILLILFKRNLISHSFNQQPPLLRQI